jgi:hypothetical protein
MTGLPGVRGYFCVAPLTFTIHNSSMPPGTTKTRRSFEGRAGWQFFHRGGWLCGGCSTSGGVPVTTEHGTSAHSKGCYGSIIHIKAKGRWLG